MSLYSVRDLAITIGDTELVRGISFEIAPGECLALVGESGSGKSLTCLTPFGLSVGSATGSVILDGDELVGQSEAGLRTLRALKTGFIFQQPLTALTPHLTIGKQLREAAMQTGTQSPDKAALVAMLERVDLPRPEEMLSQYPHRLSGGQRQRVMIAAAIAHHPKLLIADEPTTALDASLRHEIMTLLDDLRKETGMGVLLVSHDLASVAQHADTITVMKNGNVVESGKAKQVITAPKADYTKALMAASPKLDAKLPKRQKVGGVLLEADAIKVSFPRAGWRSGRLIAVDQASFRINQGEAVALVGESGSGKSTLGRAIARLGPCDEGSIYWQGQAFPARSKMQVKHRKCIQPVFQDPVASLDPRWRVKDIIAEPLANLGPEKDQHTTVTDALRAVELDPDMAERFPRQLSGGQAQRVAIARALIADPQMLLLDEATSALDVLVAAQIIALLQKLQKERGVSILAITHDLALARLLCHHIIVLDAGKIVEQGDAAEIVANPQHPVTQRLVAASK